MILSSIGIISNRFISSMGRFGHSIYALSRFRTLRCWISAAGTAAAPQHATGWLEKPVMPSWLLGFGIRVLILVIPATTQWDTLLGTHWNAIGNWIEETPRCLGDFMQQVQSTQYLIFFRVVKLMDSVIAECLTNLCLKLKECECRVVKTTKCHLFFPKRKIVW